LNFPFSFPDFHLQILEICMQNSQTTHPLLRILRDIILFDIVIFSALGLIHLFSGWQTTHQYGNGLIWAGAIGAILLLVSAGWRDGRRQDLVALSQVMREHEVFYLLNSDNSGRARFMLVSLIALLISLAVGLILIGIP
jgi:hypothetical protein